MLITAVAILLLGLVVLMRQNGARSYAFFAATVFAALWSLGLAAFLSFDSVQALRVISIFHYIMSVLVICTFTIFSLVYIRVKFSLILWVLLIAPAIAFAVLMITDSPLLLSAITVGENGASNTATVNLVPYSIYAVSFIIYFLVAFVRLIIGLRHASTPDSYNRISYIILAYVLAGSVGMFFNLILPWMGNYDLIWAGPLGLLLFAGIVYVAMARYHLFAMRTIVVRFAMYAYILTAIGVLYMLIFYVVVTRVLGMSDVGLMYYAVNIIITLALILLSAPIIKYANKLVDRWFLRDNYDPNELIASVNRLAVQEHDPLRMTTHVAREIAKTLRLSYVQIVFEQRGDDERIVAGTRAKNIPRFDEVQILALVQMMRKQIVVADEITAYADDAKLFRKYNISAFVSIGIGNDEKGYMLLGVKRHRGVFVRKDHETLITIANIMAIAIESARYYQRIQQFNETLNERVREATTELKATNRRLKKLDEAKDDFISMASHQLRTPLTSVRGYLSMVLDGDTGDLNDDQRRVLSEAYVNSERMAFLISDFLDVSRIQTGKFELQKSLTALDIVLNSEIVQLSVTAKAHNINLQYFPPDNLPHTMCDKNKLRQVIINMIDNAIFYSPADSTVEISLYQNRGQIYFTVRDHGIGVPRGEQMKLFTKFYRGSNARKVRPDGTGIGLYMARKVVLAHGGTIIFESKENIGSTFGFRIPIV